MKYQLGLLSLAVASALAVSATVESAPTTPRLAATTRAQALIDGPAARAIGRSASDRFVVKDIIRDRNGAEHVRFDRTYLGLPVIGGDVVVHSRAGQLQRTSGSLKNAARPRIAPAITAEDAIVEAGAHFAIAFQGKPQTRLVVYAMHERANNPALAYEVRMQGVKASQLPTDMRYYVDAGSGKLLGQWDTVHTAVPGPDGACPGAVPATGTGKTKFGGDVVLNTVGCRGGSNHWLYDLTRGGNRTYNMNNRQYGPAYIFTDADNVWGNNQYSDTNTLAADVHYATQVTWDYYKTTFGRLGIANDGVGAMSRVHYGRNFVNAFWSDACFCMTYGDGDRATYNAFTALDDVAHEMTHGITSRTAGLVYSGESGGLNEATSDIFGTAAEFFANNPADPGDWLSGEHMYIDNPNGTRALRYMFKPSLDGVSADCYTSDVGTLDVHYSSGVANRFFFLLSAGAVVPAGFGAGTPANLTPNDLVCNGNTALTAIGIQAAEQIWYKALTTYMTSGTTFAQARTATLSAAADLYGAGSVQHNAVAAAWSAVNVN